MTGCRSATLLKRNYGAGVFVLLLWNFWEQLVRRTSVKNCFCWWSTTCSRLVVETAESHLGYFSNDFTGDMMNIDLSVTPWTQDVIWTNIRHSEDVLDVFWTSYLRSICFLCLRGKILKEKHDSYMTGFSELATRTRAQSSNFTPVSVFITYAENSISFWLLFCLILLFCSESNAWNLKRNLRWVFPLVSRAPLS